MLKISIIRYILLWL